MDEKCSLICRSHTVASIRSGPVENCQFYNNIWYVQQGEHPVLSASIIQLGIWASSITTINIQEKELSGKCEHIIRRQSVSRETEEYRKEKGEQAKRILLTSHSSRENGPASRSRSLTGWLYRDWEWYSWKQHTRLLYSPESHAVCSYCYKENKAGHDELKTIIETQHFKRRLRQ